MYGADGLFLMLDQSWFSIMMRNTVWMGQAPVQVPGRVVVVVVAVVVDLDQALVPRALLSSEAYERHRERRCGAERHSHPDHSVPRAQRGFASLTTQFGFHLARHD